ncbi:MAG: tetratricopeptide repeat protein [Proteobacteria bacterium]|nr:tetratricopeptide repeat protein [Pseudomonadota bacterium]
MTIKSNAGRKSLAFNNDQIWSALIILAAVAIVFGQSIGFDFLSWDDDQNVVNNKWLYPGLWTQFWYRPYLCLFLPPVYSAWYLLSQITSPLDPKLFHATNVIVHGFNSCLVFLIARTCIQNDAKSSPEKYGELKAFGFALTAALLFAVHPLQVEPVAWVTGLRDLLSAMGALLAATCFLQESRRPALAILGWLAFFFAMLCKPSAVALPVALLFVLWSHKPKSPRKLFRLVSAWLLTTIPIILITNAAQTEIADKDILNIGLAQRFLVAVDSYGFYLKKWLVPIKLISDYGRKPNVVLADPNLTTNFLMISLIAALFWVFRHKLGSRFIGWILFAGVMVLPTSGIVPFPFQHTSTVSDHYFYLSMLGFAICLAQIIWRLSAPLALALSLAVLLTWSTLSLRQIQKWQNDETLFPAMIAENPLSYAGQTGMAALAMRQKKYEEALSFILAAQHLDPLKVDLLANKGLVLNELGRYQEVLAELGSQLPSKQIVFNSPVSAPSVAVMFMMVAYANIKLGHIAESLPPLCMAQWADANNKDVIGFMPLVLKHLNRNPSDPNTCAPFIN